MADTSQCHNASISVGRDGKRKCDVCGHPVGPDTNANMSTEEGTQEQGGATGDTQEQGTSGEGTGTAEQPGAGEGSGEGAGEGSGAGEQGSSEGQQTQ